MKVSGVKSGSAQKTSGGKKASQGGKAKSGSVSASNVGGVSGALTSDGVDAVEVNDHRETIEVIKNLVAGQPEVRTDEVERISNQLKSGKYKINHERVADGFIKEAIMTEIARRSAGKSKASGKGRV